ncbi:MAG: hypothetical protein ABIA08_00350 [bacterium]
MEILIIKNRKYFQQKGIVLILTLMTLGILLLLAAYFLTFSLTETKISQNQIAAAKTYYLAEAGVNEAIWKLKNDSTWKDNFETEPGCTIWSDSFSREGTLFSNGSYQVSIENSDCARGQIFATSTLSLPKMKTAQRVIKTKVFKSLGSLTGDGAVFSGGNSENVDINASILNIYDGNLFGNNNVNISWWSEVNIYDNPVTESVEGKALANNNLNISSNSIVNATSFCAKNICQGDCLDEGCPPSNIAMPMIDFDSEDENSYKNKANAAQDSGLCSVLCDGIECETKCVFTSNQFEDLLWDMGQDATLTLNNDITYVTGPIEIKGGRRLVINGTLVVDGTIDIGERNCWTRRGEKDCGFNQITINDPGVDIPSGLLTKDKLNFGSYSSFQNIEMVGLIYANDEIRIVSLPYAFNLIGGILGRKVSFTSVWEEFNIFLDNSIILEGVWAGPKPPEGVRPSFSPIVTIEHWEEAY